MPNHRRNYSLGQPVWACMEGYPWWPGRVVTVAEVTLDPGHAPPDVGENEFLVEFFNDNKRFASMHIKSLRTFTEPRFRELNKSNKQYVDDLEGAIEEAREYCRLHKWADPYDSSPTPAKERKKPGKKRRHESDDEPDEPDRSGDHLDAPPDKKTVRKPRRKSQDPADALEKPRKPRTKKQKRPRPPGSPDEQPRPRKHDPSPPATRPRKRDASPDNTHPRKRVASPDGSRDSRDLRGDESRSPPARRPRASSASSPHGRDQEIDDLPPVPKRSARDAGAEHPNRSPAAARDPSPSSKDKDGPSETRDSKDTRSEGPRDAKRPPAGEDELRDGDKERADSDSDRDDRPGKQDRPQSRRRSRSRGKGGKPERGAAGDDRMDEQDVLEKISRRKDIRAQRRETQELVVDAKTEEKVVDKSEDERAKHSRPRKEDPTDAVRRPRGRRPSTSGKRAKEEEVEVEVPAKPRKKRAKDEDEVPSGSVEKPRGRGKEQKPAKRQKANRKTDVLEVPQPDSGGYMSLSKEDLVELLHTREEEIRSYRLHLWKCRLDQLKTVPDENFITSASRLRERCGKVVRSVHAFVDAADVEDGNPEKSKKWKGLEEEAVQATIEMQRVCFDIALLQPTKVGSKMLELARQAKSHSPELTRALRDLLVQWCDIVEVEELSEREASQESGKAGEQSALDVKDDPEQEVIAGRAVVDKPSQSKSDTQEDDGSETFTQKTTVHKQSGEKSPRLEGKESRETRSSKADGVAVRSSDRRVEKHEGESGAHPRTEERAKSFTPATARAAFGTAMKNLKPEVTETEISKFATALEKCLSPRGDENQLGYYMLGKKLTKLIKRIIARKDEDGEDLFKKLMGCASKVEYAEALVEKARES